ncbi:MAG TPA: hypothetical protein VGA95_03525 [Thermodesulfobacteriota bacterium]
MWWLDRIFDVFSRRPRPTEEPLVEVSRTFRNRVLMWCAEVFGNKRVTEFGIGGDYTIEFWNQIHRILRYRHGEAQLSHTSFSSPAEDAFQFVTACPTEQFLDLVEDVFSVDCLSHVHLPREEMVRELNAFLVIDGLPYFLTDYVTERVKSRLYGREHEAIQVVSYPRVVCRGNELIHTQVIVPTLEFLQRGHFRLANDEFLDALQDYRKGDYGDCLTKCGSAFESVLKILCDRKGWLYKQTDNVSTLVKIFLDNTQLESYFEQLLMIVPTLRNRLSKSHGAGTVSKKVPQHIAQFAINSTASAILLMVYEAGEK